MIESRSQAVVTSPYNYRKLLSAALTQQQQENHFVIPPPANDSSSVVQVTTCPNVDGTEEPNILMSTPFLTNGIQKSMSGMASFCESNWTKFLAPLFLDNSYVSLQELIHWTYLAYKVKLRDKPQRLTVPSGTTNGGQISREEFLKRLSNPETTCTTANDISGKYAKNELFELATFLSGIYCYRC